MKVTRKKPPYFCCLPANFVIKIFHPQYRYRLFTNYRRFLHSIFISKILFECKQKIAITGWSVVQDLLNSILTFPHYSIHHQRIEQSGATDK